MEGEGGDTIQTIAIDNAVDGAESPYFLQRVREVGDDCYLRQSGQGGL